MRWEVYSLAALLWALWLWLTLCEAVSWTAVLQYVVRAAVTGRLATGLAAFAAIAETVIQGRRAVTAAMQDTQATTVATQAARAAWLQAVMTVTIATAMDASAIVTVGELAAATVMVAAVMLGEPVS